MNLFECDCFLMIFQYYTGRKKRGVTKSQWSVCYEMGIVTFFNFLIEEKLPNDKNDGSIAEKIG